MKQEYKRFKQYMEMLHNTVYHEPETPDFHNKLIDELNRQVIDPMLIPFDTQILDIGCGSGYWMEKMREKGYDRLTGITYNDDDIAFCNEKKLHVLKNDFTFTELPDSYAGFIFCRQALEHSPFPMLTLLEFNRLLKKDGKAYIEVPAPDMDRKHEENVNHFSILGAKMWRELYRRAGFHIDWFQELELDLTDTIDFITVDQKEKFYCAILTKMVELDELDK